MIIITIISSMSVKPESDWWRFFNVLLDLPLGRLKLCPFQKKSPGVVLGAVKRGAVGF
jgi:hypothetical protein